MLARLPLSLIVGLTAPTLALMACWRWWETRTTLPETALADWRQQLATLDDVRATEVLQQAGERGLGGCPALVAALASERPELIAQAKRQLLRQLDDWTLLEPAAGELRRCTLAELLAVKLEEYDANGERAAIDLAMRMLAEPSEPDGAASARLLTACEKILQHGNQLRGPTHVPQIGATAPSDAMPILPALSSSPTLLQPHVEAQAGNARGALLQPPPLPPKSTLGPDSSAKPQAAANPGKLLVEDNAPLLQPVPAPTAARIGSLPTGQSHDTAATLAALSLIETLQLWHDAPVAHRQTIENELRRRGINARQIEVGLGLTSPLADERRRWLEKLPRIAGIDPKPWLLWLSRDESPDVRLATLQMMATGSEPDFQRRASEMSLGDTSSDVRELAQRVARGASDQPLRR